MTPPGAEIQNSITVFAQKLLLQFTCVMYTSLNLQYQYQTLAIGVHILIVMVSARVSGSL